jgi:NitT/TauT family transport system ATP-binding protein
MATQLATRLSFKPATRAMPEMIVSPTAAPRLELRSLNKSFRTKRRVVHALKDVSFSVAPGEFVCILGPSGCGKSTLLYMIAGLEQADSGQIIMNGQPINGPDSNRVLIFQEPALFPWLNVHDNVAFGLNIKGMPRSEQEDRIQHFLKLVRLDTFSRSYVHELSGGMKQRVALARAVALDPEVLLMDEPFGALDAQTRDRLHDELQAIWADTRKTIVFVTHNVREAMVLGDRVLLLSQAPARVCHEYRCELPRPRAIEDHAMVDAAREVIADLKAEVIAAEEEERERLAK